MISPYSEQVVAALETLIAPGGRAQISPFIQSAQATVLFDQSAGVGIRTVRDIENLLRSKQEVIERLSDVWDRFYDNKSFFDPSWYRKVDFLDFYLAYYFPVNVAKLQLNLIQYLRSEGSFPVELSIVEVGVGTGTTISAIADFLLAWDCAARLFGVEIPVKSFRYMGIDRSSEARGVASKLALALSQSINAMADNSSPMAALVIEGLSGANWVDGDPLNQDFTKVFSAGNVMVLSYVLDEIKSKEEQLLLASQSLNMPDGGVLFLLEPGGERTATNLMHLRERLVGKWPQRFCSTGPCGLASSSKERLAACARCWNSRQQSLAEPRLYRAVRRACHEKRIDRRSFDEFENSLLSWSYFWMTLGQSRNSSTTKTKNSKDAFIADSGAWPESVRLNFRRRIAQHKSSPSALPPRGVASSGHPIATNSSSTVVNAKLINEALKQEGIDPSDAQAIHQAMREKRFSEAESIARRILTLESQNPVVPIEKLEYLPEQGPDDASLTPETLLFCWGSNPVAPLEIHLPRPMGFLTGKLFHGDEVVVQGAGYERDAKNKVTLRVSSDSRIVLQRATNREAVTACPSDKVLDALAYRFFGFHELRPFQRKVIQRALSGKNILAIAATGSGKSECFILPAMLSQGVTIVVSPLVSLMSDQYEQRIRDRYGLDYLTTIFHGSLSLSEKNSRLRRLELGYYKLAYFTPEQLERDYILDSLRRTHESVGISFLAADEAHCIAQWGHDFRPAYLNLYKRLKSHGIDPVRIALTATASPNVRKDICEELELDLRPIEDGGDVYLESSNRPELNLIVRAVKNTGEKTEDIVERLVSLQKQNRHNERPGAAIVFTPLTGGDPNQIDYKRLRAMPNGGKFSAGVARFGSFLESELGKRISIYHSKMDMDDEQTSNVQPTVTSSAQIGDLSGRTRRGEQRAFIECDTDVMVATKGFGMGIDKDNIRLVLHRSPPANLEAYAQEAGRAGRDGELADVVLYYSPDRPPDNDSASKDPTWSDHDIQSFFLDSKYIRRIDVQLIHAWVHAAKPTAYGSYYLTTPDLIEFAEQVKRNPDRYSMDEPFEWPTFEPYQKRLKAFGDHLEILERGHWFDNVSDYINRILQALYRMRPEINGRRSAFLSKADKCGIEFVWRGTPTIHAAQAISSNLYFGQAFRDAGVTETELTSLISTNPTTAHLAARMGRSLRETFSLLTDLKAAETAKPLVGFLWIDVPRITNDLASWRERYGARTRIKPPHGRPATIDDWFPMKSLTRPKGWEIQVGNGYSNTPFEVFLDRFIALHDERESNDKKSYQRLLTDYIGVTTTGDLQSGQEARQCLRSVLLGYLETGELVDGNCRSCSNCVSDERKLKDFSIEARREVVVRMTPTLKSLFDKLRTQDDAIASEEDTATVFESIRTEEQAGRSLRGYFAGWSGKLLDENPEHQTALWLRLRAMAGSQVLAMDNAQFLGHASTLSKTIAAEDRERLVAAVSE